MKRHASARRSEHTMQLSAFRIRPIALACASVLLPAAAAYADEPQELQAVVVTGIRQSIETSMSIKKKSDSIVESITAEDIGKLPDVSIAESIARLPGVAAQRVAGRASVIAVRGMAPDFAVTLMNGRELVSTNMNRGVEYDQYPSELINAITVYKTPDATLSAQGLSGTVNLQTLKPLDMKERSFSFNVRGEKNSNGALNANSTDRGERLSFTYVDQFLDHTLGVSVGFAHLNTPTQTRRFNTWGYDTDNGLPPGNENVFKVGGAEIYAQSAKDKRDGLMATIEFKPSKNLHSSVDLYYSQFDQVQDTRAVLFSVGPSWDGTSILNPVIKTVPGTTTQLITAGTLTGVLPIQQSNHDTRKDTLFALGWNTELKLDDWKLMSDLSYSSADSKRQTLESYAGGPIDNNLQFNIPFGDKLPTFTTGYNYADPNIVKLVDIGGWGQDAYMRKPHIKDDLASLKLSAKRSMDWFFSDVEAGINYSDRKKNNNDADFQYFLKPGTSPLTAGSDILLRPTSLAFAGIPGVLTYDMLGALNKYYDLGPNTDPQGSLYLRRYTVTEKIGTVFGKLGIDQNLGPVPVRGNLGIQVINTDQSSTGTQQDGSAAPTRGATYTDVLPSLNLNFDLHAISNDLYVRFGAAETLARPRMDDLKASASVGVGTDHLWSGSSGNPKLKPWKADAYDISTEKYFGKGSYIAAAGFFKKLKTYIYEEPKYVNFNTDLGYSNPTTGPQPISPMGVLNTPVNGTGGLVRGTEFSGALEAGLITRYLDGFGVLGSVSNTQSTVHPRGPNTTDSLPGLSGVVKSITVYYEKHGFSARVAQRDRSSFRAEQMGAHGIYEATEILGERITDLQLGYAIESGHLKGLSFLFQVNNLKDTPYRTRYIGNVNGTVDAVGEFQQYGRQYLFGVNYKL